MTSVLFISKSERFVICENYPILCYIRLESLHQRVLQAERTLLTALFLFIIMFIYHISYHIFLLKQVVFGCNTADVDLLSTTYTLFFKINIIFTIYKGKKKSLKLIYNNWHKKRSL